MYLKNYKKCIVRGDFFHSGEMLRFVLSPEGFPVCDFKFNLPGEDFWVCASGKDILQAINIFNSGKIFASERFIASEEFFLKICKEQKQRCIQLLSFVKKAGKLTVGYDKVKKLLKENRLSILFNPSDGSDKEQKRLLGKKVIKNYKFLTKEDLLPLTSGCFASHIGVSYSNLSEKLIWESDRFERILCKD